jgi:hypothetical protein
MNTNDADTIRNLRACITGMQEQARLRNVQLDAMGWVWCTGGCKGGMYRYSENEGITLTAEMVEEAERNVKRMRTSYANQQYKASFAKRAPKANKTFWQIMAGWLRRKL